MHGLNNLSVLPILNFAQLASQFPFLTRLCPRWEREGALRLQEEEDGVTEAGWGFSAPPYTGYTPLSYER